MAQQAHDATNAATPPASRMSIPEALKCAQTGDHDAFVALFYHYKRPVFGHLYKLSGWRYDVAEELLGDVTVKVWANFHKAHFDCYEKFVAWVKTIASRTAFDWFQKLENKIEWVPLPESEGDDPQANTLDEFLSTPGFEDEVCEQDANQETIACIREVLKSMPPQWRMCLLLQVQEEKSQAEIAEELDIKEKTVSCNVSRARELLRAELGRAKKKPSVSAKGGQTQ